MPGKLSRKGHSKSTKDSCVVGLRGINATTMACSLGWYLSLSFILSPYKSRSSI